MELIFFAAGMATAYGIGIGIEHRHWNKGTSPAGHPWRLVGRIGPIRIYCDDLDNWCIVSFPWIGA
jgi:hypothetical protein